MNYETMKQQFKEHGFEQVEYLGNSTYRLNIMSDVTGASYPLYVKTATSEKGGLFVHFEEADFEENDTVPLQVRSAALDKLKELKLKSTSQSVEKNKKWLDGTKFRRNEKARQGNESYENRESAPGRRKSDPRSTPIAESI